ncbi:MAG: hypothetical protein ABW123_08455 [Cystobacter sp.]
MARSPGITCVFFLALTLLACEGVPPAAPSEPSTDEAPAVEHPPPPREDLPSPGPWSGPGRAGRVQQAWRVKGTGMDIVQATAWTPDGDLLVLSRSTGGRIDGSAILSLIKYSPAGRVRWSRELRHESQSRGMGYYDVKNLMAVDARGSIILAGLERGETYLGLETWVRDAYVAKLDVNGLPVWTRSFATGDDPGLGLQALAVDASGAIVLGGLVAGPVDVGGQRLTREDKAFVIRYTPDGTLDWVRTVSPEPRTHPGPQARVQALAVDGEGHIIAAGSYTGKLLPGGATASGMVGAPFLLRWDARGALTWGRDFEGQTGELFSVGATPEGHVAAVGRFQGTLTWGGKHLVEDTPGAWGSFLVVGDARGQAVAARSLRAANVSTLTVDPRGRIYLGGHGPADADLGGGPMMDSPRTQLFLARYSLSAEHAWSRTFPHPSQPLPGDIGDRYLRTLSIQPGRKLVAGGCIQMPTDFDGTVIAPEPVPGMPLPPPDGYLLHLEP